MPVPNSPTATYRRFIPVDLPTDMEEEISSTLGKPPRPVYTTKFDQGRYTVGVEAYVNNNSDLNTHRKTSCPSLSGVAGRNRGLAGEGVGPTTGSCGGGGGYHRSRERTRQSAVQRLVDRKQAQKEKEREKERDRSLGFNSQSSRRDCFSSRQSFHSYSPTRDQRDHSGSRSENGYILGAGRCSSPSKENIEPDFFGANHTGRRRTARSVSGTRLRSSNEEPIAKTYITIGPGKPTRIREHSPAKSAKLTSDETVTSARERFAQSSRNGSPSINASRHSSPSPHRKTSRTISPSKSKDILRKASPLKSTDILKTFRASKSDTKFNHLPDVNQNTEPYLTEKILTVNQSISEGPDGATTTSHSRRLSQDIQNNITAQQVLNERNKQRASPASDRSSASSLSSPSSSLSGSTDSVELSFADKPASVLSQRRISLEQRFQARAASSVRLPASPPDRRRRASVHANSSNSNHHHHANNINNSATTYTTTSGLDASTKVDDTWTHIKIRRYSTVRTQRDFPPAATSTNSKSTSSVHGLDRPIPASRKISLPPVSAAGANRRRPEPAPRRRSLTAILVPERSG